MNNGAKKLSTLELERDTPTQQEADRPFMTVSEAMPELTRIAIQENLNLNIGKEFNEAVKEMDRRKLNR